MDMEYHVELQAEWIAAMIVSSFIGAIIHIYIIICGNIALKQDYNQRKSETSTNGKLHLNTFKMIILLTNIIWGLSFIAQIFWSLFRTDLFFDVNHTTCPYIYTVNWLAYFTGKFFLQILVLFRIPATFSGLPTITAVTTNISKYSVQNLFRLKAKESNSKYANAATDRDHDKVEPDNELQLNTENDLAVVGNSAHKINSIATSFVDIIPCMIAVTIMFVATMTTWILQSVPHITVGIARMNNEFELKCCTLFNNSTYNHTKMEAKIAPIMFGIVDIVTGISTLAVIFNKINNILPNVQQARAPYQIRHFFYRLVILRFISVLSMIGLYLVGFLIFPDLTFILSIDETINSICVLLSAAAVNQSISQVLKLPFQFCQQELAQMQFFHAPTDRIPPQGAESADSKSESRIASLSMRSVPNITVSRIISAKHDNVAIYSTSAAQIGKEMDVATITDGTDNCNDVFESSNTTAKSISITTLVLDI